MKIAGGKKLTFWEWVIVFGAVAAAIAASSVAGLSPKWEHAFVYTVIVFATVIIVLRPAWGRPAFWRGLTIVFLVHISGTSLITQALPPENRGIRGLPLIAACIVEGLLIVSILWKTSHRRSFRSPTYRS